MERFLPLLLTLLSSVNLSKGCTHLYGIQPWQNPELRLCTLLNATVRIACSVQGADNQMRIEWYRSTIMQLAGQAGGASIQSDGRHLVESMRNTKDRLHNCESTLSISDFQEADFGYYWCMIGSRELGQPTLLPNPSHIILISEPCNPTARQCESPLELYNKTQGDCADEAITTVIPPGSPECTQPATTSVVLVPSPTYTYTIQPTVTSIVPSIVQVMVAQTNESSSTELFHTPLGVSHIPHPSTRNGVDSASLASSSVATQLKLTTTSVAPQSKLEPSPTEVVLASEAQDKGGIDQIVWLLIGVAVAILLVAIMIVLTAIVCIQCKRGKTKGSYRITTSNTNLEVVEEETGSMTRTSQNKKQQLDQRANSEVPQDHDYSEIPVLLGNDTPVYQIAPKDSSMTYYEDVLPDLTQSVRRHPYDTVVEGSSDYNKLQHQNSVNSQVSTRSGVKLQVSRQSSAATCTDLVSAVESKSNSLQRTQNRHINIYDSELDIPSLSDEDNHQTIVPPSSESVYNTTLHCNGAFRRISLDERGSECYSHVNTKALEATLLMDSGQIEMQQFESLYDSASDIQELKLHGATNDHTETKQSESDPVPFEFTAVAKDKSDSESDYEQLDRLEAPVVPHRDDNLTKSVSLSAYEDSPDYHTKHSSEDTSYNHLTTTTDSKSRKEAHTLATFKMLHENSDSSNCCTADGAYSRLDITPHTQNRYTPIISSQLSTQNVYNVPIVITPEMYVSEHGHHYHVLEGYVDN